MLVVYVVIFIALMALWGCQNTGALPSCMFACQQQAPAAAAAAQAPQQQPPEVIFVERPVWKARR